LYVPGTVSVTVNVWPAVITSGEFATVAPEGTLLHVTSWGAPLWLSWSTKVTTVPGATVTLAGEKFSDWSFPTFWGITIVTAPPAAALLDTALVAEVEDGVLLVVVVVEIGVLEVEVTEVEIGVLLEVEVAEEELTADEELEMAVVDEAEELAEVVALLVELAVTVGLPAPFVVHHIVVHVDDVVVALLLVVAAELDAAVDAEFDAEVVVAPGL
jgi:hypothetical protein